MQYLISVIDDEQTIAATSATSEGGDVDAFNDRLKAEGYWVYANGLGAPDTATVIDNRGGVGIFSDGPFIESKEFLGGLWIIEGTDLDVALKLAAEGSKCCNRKVELRPFHDHQA